MGVKETSVSRGGNFLGKELSTPQVARGEMSFVIGI